MAEKTYKLQYCTLWNRKIPGVVLRNVESMNSSIIYSDENAGNPVQEYRLGGSFVCNNLVEQVDLEKSINGIENLVNLESKYDGQLFINVPKPFSEVYPDAKRFQKPSTHPNFGSAGGCDAGAIG